MLKNIQPRHAVELIERSIEFTNEDGAGFSFDCDENGKPVFACSEAEQNYKSAIEAGPEAFPVAFNEFTVRRRTVIEDARGTCSCGEEVELYDQYQGACQCPKCGQWYNLYGQSLIDPEYWDESDEEY